MKNLTLRSLITLSSYLYIALFQISESESLATYQYQRFTTNRPGRWIRCSKLQQMEWDSELGVWKGERAFSVHDQDMIPNPLYIFGYGSLIWRPGEYLERCKSFKAEALSFLRIFAQRSYDHRGNSEFPGLVLNLIPKSILDKSEGFNNICALSKPCIGLVWNVPSEDIENVINDLDYREKGGYSRHLMSIRLLESTPHFREGEVINALVYTGLDSNPNYYLPPSLSVAADIISAAKGPSGTNVEYLLRLQQDLSSRFMSDTYINRLAEVVRLRIGPWRRQLVLRQLFSTEISFLNTVNDQNALQPKLLGWGSNEHFQLSAFRDSDEVLRIGSDIETSLHPFARPLNMGSITHEASTSSLPEHDIVVAGGATSAYISSRYRTVSIWGALAESIISVADDASAAARSRQESVSDVSVILEGVSSIALSNHHGLLLDESGIVISFGSNSHGQCNTPDLVGVMLSREILQEISSSGDKATRRFKINVSSIGFAPQHHAMKIACGLRHSGIITTCGALISWGDDKNGQVTKGLVWRPPDETGRLIDISCGAKHTVVVTETGRIFSQGWNRYGSLGREILTEGSSRESRSDSKTIETDATMKEVSLPTNIRFQKVASGWYHTIARGIEPTGRLVFYAWGRRDMSQYLPIDSLADAPLYQPVPLKSLPVGNISEVWCGSEFTVVAEASVSEDLHGKLWSCGWNEHFNLGIGPGKSTFVSEWRNVCDSAGANVTVCSVWEGSVACGGAHVICLSN